MSPSRSTQQHPGPPHTGPLQEQNEAYYIIGLDVGNQTSALAFYNIQTNQAEPIDLSGGFAKAAVPTRAQYIEDTGEWIFGEYAMTSTHGGVVFDDLVRRLGQNAFVETPMGALPIAEVLGKYIAWLIGYVSSINPRAQIAGIVAGLPGGTTKAAADDFARAVAHAGYADVLLDTVPERLCILAEHYRASPSVPQLALVLDFGSQMLRGGLCSVAADGAGIAADSTSFVFDTNISTDAIDSAIHNIFTQIYDNHAAQGAMGAGAQVSAEALAAFTYSHKDVFFQKSLATRAHKLYFNFAYPPFAHEITAEHADALLKPFARALGAFIKQCFEKTAAGDKILPRQVTTVLCTGGGFEANWARTVVRGLFPKGKIAAHKSPKLVCAMGAARIAANRLGCCETPVSLTDVSMLQDDIGLWDGSNFVVLAAKGGFWWQAHPTVYIIINAAATTEITLHIAKKQGRRIRALFPITLQGLPARPKGTAKLALHPEFLTAERMRIRVQDAGFGDLFPAGDYAQEWEGGLGG